jgi:hypothetical protein
MNSTISSVYHLSYADQCNCYSMSNKLVVHIILQIKHYRLHPEDVIELNIDNIISLFEINETIILN